MKIFRLSILALSISTATACTESIPQDNSAQFAAKVAHNIYATAITPLIIDLSVIHKANAWREASSEQERYDIEDLYLSSIAPRIEDNKIEIITRYGNYITVEHNNIPITTSGARWSISSDDTFTGYKITVENCAEETIEATFEKPNGEVVSTMRVQLQAIDKYIIEFDATLNNYIANSPITSEHIYTISPIAVSSFSRPPYAINNQLSITDGKIAIELLQDNEQTGANDDVIKLTFEDNQYDFNPLIEYRQETFYYEELFYLGIYYY